MALFEYLLRLGDSDLVLSQRLGEWCGHGPVLEEDLALYRRLAVRGPAESADGSVVVRPRS